MRIKLRDDQQLVIDKGREAWASMRRDETWEKWILIGRAIEAARSALMHQLGLNRPTGKTFAIVYGEFLRENGFETIDKGVRSRLQSCLDNIAQISTWRESLGASRRLELNHPNAVWRRWQATARPAAEPDPAGPPKANPKDAEIVRLQEELDTANARIAQLERELAAAREDLAHANPATAVKAALKSRRRRTLDRDPADA
jgi:hypothetical protein